jgi:uncharacterized phiE125 gp8 family phage protein
MIEPRLIAPPTEFPATLEQVKWHLRVDHDQEDSVIALYMQTALGLIERKIRRAVMASTWEMTLDAFPSAEIRIPWGPVASIVSIVYVDEDGAEQTLDANTYVSDRAGWVVLEADQTWPNTISAINAVRVRWIAEGDLTPEIIQAFLLLVGHFYAHREAVGEKRDAIPLGVASILAPLRASLILA